jgi:glycosyltransferase involved in cell wall biosynthesis/O-antigen ligase
MPVKTLLFLGGFAAVAVATFFHPLIGVLGYAAHYCTGPEQQWWAAAVKDWGLRYSFTLAALTAVSTFIHRRELNYGKVLLVRHEKLLLLFLGAVWLAYLLAEPTEGRYSTIDPPAVKMVKVVIFILMLTHIVTTRKQLDAFLWVLVIGAMVLGIQAWMTPRSQFLHGRLQGIGGPDFTEANFLAAYLAAMLPLIGVMFLRTTWPGKVLCLGSGVFVTNAIILTRSRGALVGFAGGLLTAALLAPRKYRAKILIGVVVASIGGYALTDPQFIQRAATITRDSEERDRSAQSRLEIWEGGVAMFQDHPMGVGPGNFYQNIGRYSPANAGRDAHNTFVRCFTELGFLGIAIFLVLLGNAAITLIRMIRRSRMLPAEEGRYLLLAAYAIAVSLATFVTSGLTVSFIYTEATWWLLALPVCLERAVANLEAEVVPVLPGRRGPARARVAASAGSRPSTGRGRPRARGQSTGPYMSRTEPLGAPVPRAATPADTARHEPAPDARRVAILTSELGAGGAEAVIVHLAAGLKTQGVEAAVCCLQGKGVRAAELESRGVPVHALESARWYDLGALRGLRRFLNTFRPDVVSVHDRWSLPYAALVSLAGCRWPIVFTSHGLLFGEPERGRWRYRLAARRVSAVTAVSREVADRHIRYFGWSVEPEIVPNGVPPQRRCPDQRRRIRGELGIANGTFVFLAAGNARPEKAFEDLLRAAADLGGSGAPRDWAVLVAGWIAETDYCRNLLALHQRLGLTRVVRFLGFRDDLGALYSAADAFVLSSRSEGLPLVVLEAMMAGLPVIATRVGGVPHAVQDGGELVDPARPDQLGQAMRRLLETPHRAEAMGLRASQRAMSEYSLDRMVTRYRAVFDRVVSCHGHKRRYG